MPTIESARREPWTCKWGRFGGPVNARDEVSPGFVFWVCGHPQTDGPQLLGRDDCASCTRWEDVEPRTPSSAA